MDAATATIVVAGIAALSSIITATITTRRNNTKSTNEFSRWQQEFIEEQKREQAARFSDPKSHYVFAKLNHFRTIFIPSIQAMPGVTPLKARLFRQFLEIRFKVFYEEGMKWVHDQSEVKLDEVTNKICEVIREADCMALAAGVPQEFIDAFRLEQKNIVIALLDHFERIMASESLTNNNKENALLDVALNAINLTILDTEKTLKRMNGTLERLLECESFKER